MSAFFTGFTKTQLNEFYGSATRTTAESLGQQNAHWFSTFELRDKINRISPEVYNLFNIFLDKYTKWYDFNFDDEGVGRIKSDREITDSQKLERERDEARNNLLNALGQPIL